jgi:hypothetical protein
VNCSKFSPITASIWRSVSVLRWSPSTWSPSIRLKRISLACSLPLCLPCARRTLQRER